MRRFAYTGSSAGAPVSGHLDGADARAVATALIARGVTPLRIEPDRGGSAAPVAAAVATGWLARLRTPKVQPTELLLFSRQLHTLLRSGVPILRALAGLQESATGERLRQVLGDVRHSLESGIELSLSMAQHSQVFNAFYVAMVRVGETTGRLDEIFLSLFRHIEFEMFTAQQVKAALRYPSFVVGAMAIAIGVINVMVIPAFANVFKSFGADLPLPTRILVATSDFTLAYGWQLVGAAVLTVFGLRRWVATPAGRLTWDRWRLGLPLAGKIIRKATLSRFARSFAITLKSGVPVEQALSLVAQTVDNTHLGQRIDAMRQAIERGESIQRAATASGIFTPVVLQMIGIGEETGAVDELMDEVAELYGNDVQYELKTLSQQIEPILIIFLGVLVLILALGVFLPMWDLGRVALKK